VTATRAEPQLVKKRQTRPAGLDETILAMYVGGMTVRDIAAQLQEPYGIAIARDTISCVTDAVLEDVQAWRTRRLDEIYAIVYLDALSVKVREDRSVRNRVCYLAIGTPRRDPRDSRDLVARDRRLRDAGCRRTRYPLVRGPLESPSVPRSSDNRELSAAALDRGALIRSLEQQKRLLARSIVLTPVDTLPFMLADRKHTGFLHGLYISDKDRDREASMNAVVQFGGRQQAARDLAGINQLLAHALGAAEGSFRLLSGLHAHTSTFMSISTIGQTVMLLSDEAGGHFCSHAILQRLGLRTLDLPVDTRRMCIDQAATMELIEQARPDFVFIDRSEGLRYEDFAFVGKFDGPTTIFDASQYLTPILTGRYANPLAWGFDLMLFSLHKSLPGPQKAGVVSRCPGELWSRLVAGLSTLVSSSHAENTYLAGLTLLREDWLERYVVRLLATAAELESALARRGVPVVAAASQGDPAWPATHHLWVRCADRDEAFAWYEQLADANIHTNYRKLPYGLGYGLRLGTSFSAAAGIGLGHVAALAELVATAIDSGASDALRASVAELAHAAGDDAILPTAQWT
jgi:glycine hydroxymethyltransferase